MNCSQELSFNSTQESSCFQLDYPATPKEDYMLSKYPSEMNVKKIQTNSKNSNSKKQYVLKTCRFTDKRIQEIPFPKMFLTCLDVLIVESSSEMDKLKENRYLASFNYFKRVTNIERKILQDWICVNLEYVTMKKIPIKVMQQRLCNSKNKKGQKVSALLEEQLLSYNHAKKNDQMKKMSQKQMEQALQSKFCYFLEIDQDDNQEDKMERLIYDFHVQSIYFSGLLSKLVAGDTSNLISYISSNGIPEIYSEDLSYFDFWTERLSKSNKTVQSSVKTFDNYNFKCLEKIRMFQHEEKGTLLVQICFDFETPLSTPSYTVSDMTNIYKFMKSERKSLVSLLKSSKENLYNDPFVNSIFQDEKQKNSPFKQQIFLQSSFASPYSSQKIKSSSQLNDSLMINTFSDQQEFSTCGFKELSELYYF
ncbi:hypothetical protein TTHERM_00145590 (macronuclear) [Tetrahymena thermophila SB210]|uniref:Uncharacterized protein n=1 Tax=Tetrahymena thermophila (strain SB210) TaxID=312017 RepID=I7M7C2_TETTS|nr:hypothetical protein TTHERM_00145590 [Tetrahymena thermophila SB210]EAR90954.2 hypothetical protein TTHERM_00145590 [Tetrahymena thermophila SB210]|eukprot:XP_001011199.2 hypothetical protein TTHERM_00145590 [Tetrahymena thermophila SB210]